ncbi:MAG: GNAT family N-acetyltransferase [Oscillospiraceae bacterium]
MLNKNYEIIKFNSMHVKEIKMLFGKNADSILDKFNSNEIDIYAIKVSNNYVGRLIVDYKNRFLDNETKENERVGISWLLIEKDFRGNGYSSILMEYVINVLSDKGYTEFTVGVEPENKIAINLYSKHGFTNLIGSSEYPFEFNLYLKKYKNKKLVNKSYFCMNLNK